MCTRTPVRPGEVSPPRGRAKGAAGRPRALPAARFSPPPAPADPAGTSVSRPRAPRAPGPDAPKNPRGDSARDNGPRSREWDTLPPPREQLLDDPSAHSPRSPIRPGGQWAGTSPSRPAPGAGAGNCAPLPEVGTHPRGGWRAAALLNPRAHLHGPAPSVTRLARAGPSPLPLGRSF